MNQLVRNIELSKPQFRLVSTEKQFPAFVGGFGSGKTEALAMRAFRYKFLYPKLNIAYYLPTYDLVGIVAFPRFEERLEQYNIPYKSIKSPRPRIELEDAGIIHFRNMDNPSRIVGYEVADSFIDEIDIMKEVDAKSAWRQILARNRQTKPDGKRNTVAVGTTPEGFKFVYQQWKNAPPNDEYELINASTYDNIREGQLEYIQTLLDIYPENLIDAYINGNFVNLKSGSVYRQFDRFLNSSDEVIKPGEDLHIGVDFNVTNMSAEIFVNRGGWPHAVAELTGIYDTPALIDALKRRWPNQRIFIYPDASGGSRKTVDASTSDIALLEAARFDVYCNSSNPLVKDRVLSMNTMICNGNGVRKFKVNILACPKLTESLEKQAYNDKGEPDKSGGFDHVVDAAGYFICYCFPVIGRNTGRMALAGV